MAGEFSKLDFNAPSGTTDPRAQLSAFSIARDSSATYVDADGVLQTADGDATSDQSSVEDETGYTFGQGVGSFYDGQAWFSGESLGSDYSSDFSADEDGWISSNGALSGNIDAIGGQDDILRFTVDDTDDIHLFQTQSIGTVGVKYKVTLWYFIPSTNSQLNGFRLFMASSLATSPILSETDIWVKVTYYNTCTQEGKPIIRLFPYNDNNISWQDVGGDDVIYVKNATYDTVTSLATQSFSGNLLTLEDSAGKKAYGYIGSAEGGEALGSTLFDQDGGSGGSGDKGAFTLTDLRLAELDSGNLTVGTMYEISAQDGEDFTADGAPDNVVGTTFVATGTNVTLDANDKVYPIDISWVPYGTNTMEIDSDALKITYVDNDDGGISGVLGAAYDLSADLEDAKQYKLTFNTKVSVGASVQIYVYGGTIVRPGEFTITNTSYEPQEVYLTKGSGTAYIRMNSMNAGESIWIDSIVLTEVTTADAQSVTIFKEPSLATEGWAIIESGFDYNDSSMTFDVYSNTPSATAAGAESRIEADGLLNEGAGTNHALYSRDMTNAVWTATNITPLKNVTGIDGSVNSASQLTADANNGTILQSFTGLDSATHVYSVWMKRITGSGAVYMTDDNSNFTEKTLTTSWQRFDVTRSQTSATIGIKMATSGDVIAVDFNQFELNQAYRTSVIPTTSIPVARTAETQKWTMSTAFKNLMGDVADSEFTMVVEWTPKFDYGDTIGDEAIVSVKSAVSLFYIDENGNIISGDGANTSTLDINYVSGTTYLYALRVFDDGGGDYDFEVGVSSDGGATWTWDATPATYDGSFNPATYLEIGYGNEYPFNIGFVYLYDEARSQAWIESGKYMDEQALTGWDKSKFWNGSSSWDGSSSFM